jgi:hypothetical protein
MARCQCGQLDPPASEKSVRGDEQGIRPPSDQRRECCINLQAGTGIEDLAASFATSWWSRLLLNPQLPLRWRWT